MTCGLGKELAEEGDPSQPSRFISEALRVVSSMGINHKSSEILAPVHIEVYRVNHVQM
jgi:hypothetical protein